MKSRFLINIFICIKSKQKFKYFLDNQQKKEEV